MTRLCSPRTAALGILACALFVGHFDGPQAAPMKKLPRPDYAAVTFLPISLKVCDAHRKQQPDEIVISVSYKGGVKEGGQFMNYCAHQQVRWRPS